MNITPAQLRDHAECLRKEADEVRHGRWVFAQHPLGAEDKSPDYWAGYADALTREANSIVALGRPHLRAGAEHDRSGSI